MITMDEKLFTWGASSASEIIESMREGMRTLTLDMASPEYYPPLDENGMMPMIDVHVCTLEVELQPRHRQRANRPAHRIASPRGCR